MDKLNVVIVGAGQAGAQLHMPAFKSHPDVVVCGICDPDLPRAQRIAEQNMVPSAYASLEMALQNNRVQIVSICTPPQTHLNLARQAMEAGCHVLLEKPMTVTLKEADELLACRERTGRKLSVVHQNKFKAGILHMGEIVRSGKAGDVLQLDMAWLSNGDIDRMISNSNFWCHAIPGGRWAESLPHQIYIAYALVGRMRLLDVFARKLTPKWPWMKADEVNILLKSEKGYVNIRMSANLHERKRALSLLHGSKGSFLFNYKKVFQFPPPPQSDRQKLREAVSVFTKRLPGRRSGGTVVSDAHELVVHQFVQHVLHDEPPPTSIEEAYQVMELTDQFGELFEKAIRNTNSTRGV